MTKVNHLKETFCLVYPKSWQNPNFESEFVFIYLCFFRHLHITLYWKWCWYCGLANCCSLQNNIILTRRINPQKRYNTYNNMNTQLLLYTYAGLQIYGYMYMQLDYNNFPKIVLIILLLLTSKLHQSTNYYYCSIFQLQLLVLR